MSNRAVDLPYSFLYNINKGTTMQIRVQEQTSEIGKCGCGRSPTGKCIGWHGLNEEQYKEALEKYLTNQEDINGDTV